MIKLKRAHKSSLTIFSNNQNEFKRKHIKSFAISFFVATIVSFIITFVYLQLKLDTNMIIKKHECIIKKAAI